MPLWVFIVGGAVLLLAAVIGVCRLISRKRFERNLIHRAMAWRQQLIAEGADPESIVLVPNGNQLIPTVKE